MWTALQIAVGALSSVCVAYLLAGFRKMARWNKDPEQEQLISLLIAASQPTADLISRINLANFMGKQTVKWRAKEKRQRLAHALTRVERIANPTVYEKARDLAMEIGQETLLLDKRW